MTSSRPRPTSSRDEVVSARPSSHPYRWDEDEDTSAANSSPQRGDEDEAAVMVRALADDIAQRYLCGHCTSVGAEAAVTPGRIRLNVTHDPGCPVLIGVVPHWHDLRRVTTAAVPVFITHRKATP